MNKNRKLVAFAERGDRPHVVVFDLELRRRRKVLRCAEFVSQEVISLAFSHDSKYLLAQGNLLRGIQGIDNCFGKVNSVQEACAKYFAVHILKFEILQIT